MTREERQELRDAALKAVARPATLQGGHARAGASWQLQTSNSFRRLGARGDGDVLCATVQRSDGQPDLLAAPGVLEYIVAGQPRVMLKLLDALDAAEAALNQARGAVEERRAVLGEVPL